ncbi:MAG: carboxymuconolactone decarboxylase family protein [Myxococcota bacterium]
MPNLPPLERRDTPELEPLLRVAEQAMGFVPNSLLTMARWPELVRAFVPLAGLVNSPRRVPAETKSLVAFVSSRAAGCGYCQAHTSHGAERRGIASEKIEAACDFESSPLFEPAELAALRFARDASVSPAAVTPEHFRALREHYDDDQIVELAAVIALFGWLNRWNDALATTLEAAPLEFGTKHLAAHGWHAERHRP